MTRRDRRQFFVSFLLLAILCAASAQTQHLLADKEHGEVLPPINFGETIEGAISVNGEIDTYTFDGNAGNAVLVRITEIVGSLDPFIELFDPTGTSLQSDSTLGQSVEFRVTLPQQGTYSILARDDVSNGASMGTYSLFLQLFPAFQNTFTVNATGDAGDANLADGVCETATPGECTLRAAIEQANADTTADAIEFNIPGAGPHTIQPGSALPNITQPVMIDGYTQLGAMPNTLDVGSNAVLMIELDGSLAGESGVNGLSVTRANSTISGLVINRFSEDGVQLSSLGSTGNVIEGNFIGTDVTGTIDLGNMHKGLEIKNQASNNIIGGTAAAARNIISGNDRSGVRIGGIGTTGNRVEGNYIGTDVTGMVALGNTVDGVAIAGGTRDNIIGGADVGVALQLTVVVAKMVSMGDPGFER